MNDPETTSPAPIISECIDLSKSYFARSGLRAGGGKRQFVQAIDNVSLRIFRGESVGLVGESGCGKSTLGRLLIRMETPTSGEVLFDGVNITRLRGNPLRQRRARMQMIFQAATSSLNPRFTVRDTIVEAIRAHHDKLSIDDLNRLLISILDKVGLPFDVLHRRPGEFSSGERQRITIARALAVDPAFLVADEPVTSLDMSSQMQILSLLKVLQRDLQLAMLLITHDLNTVRNACNRVAVMYLGRIVESADTETLFSSPAHPYTRALIAAAPSPDPDRQSVRVLAQGDPPSPLDPPPGCHFHPRCPFADSRCSHIIPETRLLKDGHTVQCHFNFENGKPIGSTKAVHE